MTPTLEEGLPESGRKPAGDSGASGYSGGFVFSPNRGGSIGDMLKVLG